MKTRHDPQAQRRAAVTGRDMSAWLAVSTATARYFALSPTAADAAPLTAFQWEILRDNRGPYLPEPEDEFLAHSPLLPKLLAQALHQPIPDDWRQALRDL
jgi:hypothetical protein